MKRTIKILLALILAGTLYVGFAQEGEIPTTLVIGMVPSRDLDQIVDNLEPLAEMLSERLLIPVETYVSTNYVGVVEAIGTGRVDVGLMGPSGMVQAVDIHDAEIVLASNRQGSTTYRSQFNVRCDSGIQSLGELAGKTIAWVSPSSASGYQFPYVTLLTEFGIDPETEMTGTFAGSHDAAMLAVYLGDVDVAVTFGGSPGSDGRTTIATDYPDVFDQVCILGYSVDIPNDGVVLRAGLDADLKQQIVDALLDIVSTEEGGQLLSDLMNVTAYTVVDDQSVYEPVREILRRFE